MQPVVEAWRLLEEELHVELLAEGFQKDQIHVQHVAYIRYYGQLEDVEVDSPVPTIANHGDLKKLLDRFEFLYGKMFSLAAKPDKPTYHVTEVCVIAKVDTVKPKLIQKELADKKPHPDAYQGTRPVFQRGAWSDADIWRMESLVPGNEIDGLAVIEASNTTLFVPPEWHVRIDEYDIYWIERKGEK
jgi:N-methylhydantoinase A/oxoprolinase/acetone carboxylase beta subunit